MTRLLTRTWIFGLMLLLGRSLSAAPLASQIDDEIAVDEADWPWWRGPWRNGIGVATQQPPTRWSDTEHVKWRVDLPGRGHGSPTVVGTQIFVTIGDRQRDLQAVACYDRATGKQVWESIVHQGHLVDKNEKSSVASSSVAVVGDRVFATFVNGDAMYITAITRGDGHRLWQTRICDYVVHQGFGASPAPYRSLVIVTADNKAGGKIAALQQATGEIVWQRDRPQLPNYPSPIILRVAGKDQLCVTGCDLVSSYEPLTGQTIWEMPGATTECVTSTVTDGVHIITSGGYPRNHLAAVVADGSKKIAWENGERVYVPSMIIDRGQLYGVLDAGVAMCWDVATGKERWKSRLGGTFSSSLVLIGDTLYATNESAETFVYRAQPTKFELIAKNKIGEDTLSTPSICGGEIYLRVAVVRDGQRQEQLVCLSQAAK